MSICTYVQGGALAIMVHLGHPGYLPADRHVISDNQAVLSGAHMPHLCGGGNHTEGSVL